jgi:serine/threonine-protein kinase
MAAEHRPVTTVCPHCSGEHPATYTHCPKTGKALATGKALVGRLFAGRYQILGLLGEGGMGSVYVAEHAALRRKVAIKRLHPELAGDSKSVARFEREARAAAALRHPNIVEVIDLGFAEDGAPFLVMEFLDGKSLAAALRREGRLPPKRACHIVSQTLSALGAVHREGIVHRDLKPDNVMLLRHDDKPDHVKVLDFGVSKMRTENEMDLTRTGVTLGTPFYMSPEQARGQRNLDHRVDLYAAGVILYECLTGSLPHERDNYHALLQAILDVEPRSVRDVVPEVDEALSAIVRKALAKDPDRRYQSALEMAADIGPFTGVPLSRATPRQGISAFPPAMAPTLPVQSDPTIADGPPQFSPRPPPAPPERQLSSDESRMSDSGNLPRPRRVLPPPRPFRATSSDWREEFTPVSLRVGPPPEAPTPPGRVERTPVEGRGQVKATLIVSALDYLSRTYGKQSMERILAALPADDRRLLEGVILPVSWVGMPTYEGLLRSAERVIGSGSGSVAMEIGSALATRDIPSTHRLFLVDATPARAIDRLPQLWRSYYSDGQIRPLTNDGSVARVEIESATGESHVHAMAFAGFLRRLLELCGGREVRVTLVSSRARGDAKTVLAARFKSARDS